LETIKPEQEKMEIECFYQGDKQCLFSTMNQGVERPMELENFSL